MPKRITVTVDDAHLDDLEGLAAALRAAGMQVQQILSSIGIITGEVADAQRAAIVQVPGVVSVENQQVFQLPPPDSDIQ